MTILYMLDTNMVSYIVKGHSAAARKRLLALKEDEIACISAVTEAEIFYGLAKKPEAVRLKALMEGFLANIRVLPWDRDAAHAYAAVRSRLEAAGKSLESMDMMIAAHAVSLGAVVVTNDKAFGYVEDLSAAVNWAGDLK
jgi:tRNA(fMet)-specific endonuclease VapC